ncbi:MAG: hypothetical protein J6X01_01780 [Bacteroidales bacterium]|nr:hypothetical protein [Bacteroidales bacterium]
MDYILTTAALRGVHGLVEYATNPHIFCRPLGLQAYDTKCGAGVNGTEAHKFDSEK